MNDFKIGKFPILFKSESFLEKKNKIKASMFSSSQYRGNIEKYIEDLQPGKLNEASLTNVQYYKGLK